VFRDLQKIESTNVDRNDKGRATLLLLGRLSNFIHIPAI